MLSGTCATRFWILLDLYNLVLSFWQITGFLVSTSQSAAPFKRPKLRWDPHVVPACSYALGEGWHLNPSQTVFHRSSKHNRFLPLAWNKRRNTDIHSNLLQLNLNPKVSSKRRLLTHVILDNVFPYGQEESSGTIMNAYKESSVAQNPNWAFSLCKFLSLRVWAAWWKGQPIGPGKSKRVQTCVHVTRVLFDPVQ